MIEARVAHGIACVVIEAQQAAKPHSREQRAIIRTLLCALDHVCTGLFHGPTDVLVVRLYL